MFLIHMNNVCTYYFFFFYLQISYIKIIFKYFNEYIFKQDLKELINKRKYISNLKNVTSMKLILFKCFHLMIFLKIINQNRIFENLVKCYPLKTRKINVKTNFKIVSLLFFKTL